jgi:hypothetical protein
MNKLDINEERVMHIDTSGKLYENKDTGIAYKIIGTNQHRGLALSRVFKKELEKRLGAKKDYAKIYAICIYYLIRGDFNKFDVIVICGDEKYQKVKKYLDILFKGNKDYPNKEIISLYKLREITGKKKLKSYADNLANSYRRRALKSKARQQKGISLNPIRLSFNNIRDKWNYLER